MIFKMKELLDLKLELELLRLFCEGQKGKWKQDIVYKKMGNYVVVGKDELGYNVPAKEAPEGSSGILRATLSSFKNIKWGHPDLQAGWSSGIENLIELNVFALNGYNPNSYYKEIARQQKKIEQSNVAQHRESVERRMRDNISQWIDQEFSPQQQLIGETAFKLGAGIAFFSAGCIIVTGLLGLSPLLTGTSAAIGGLAFTVAVIAKALKKNKALWEGYKNSLPKEYKNREKKVKEAADLLGEQYKDEDSLAILGNLADPLEMKKALERDNARKKTNKKRPPEWQDHSPSFQQRVEETIDLYKKKTLTEDDEINLLWHRGLIDTEMEFGERLDNFSSPMRNKFKGVNFRENSAIYDSIFEDLEKNNPNRNLPSSISFSPDDDYLFFTPKERLVAGENLKGVQLEASRMKKIVGLPMDFIVEKQMGAPHVSLEDRHLTFPFYSSAVPSYYWHELGHELELSAEYGDISNSYIDNRVEKDANGDRVQYDQSEDEKLSKYYIEDGLIKASGDPLLKQQIQKIKNGGAFPLKLQQAMSKSSFSNPYVTTDYRKMISESQEAHFPKTGATELISSGMEYLQNADSMAKLSKIDREHLLFTLNFVRSTQLIPPNLSLSELKDLKEIGAAMGIDLNPLIDQMKQEL